MVSLVSDEGVRQMVGFLRKADLDVDYDQAAGTVVARDGDDVALRGIRKPGSGRWIATFADTSRVQWRMKSPPQT